MMMMMMMMVLDKNFKIAKFVQNVSNRFAMTYRLLREDLNLSFANITCRYYLQILKLHFITDYKNCFQWFQKLILIIPKPYSNDSKNWFQKVLAIIACITKIHSKKWLQTQTLLRNIACKHCCNVKTIFQNCCKWFANIAKYYTLAVRDFFKSC